MPRVPSPQTLTVLTALLNDPSPWHHGYALSKATGLQSGTLYPILMRLAERGLLEAEWDVPDEPGRKPRHAYRLTPDGTAFARDHQASAPRANHGVARIPRTAT